MNKVLLLVLIMMDLNIFQLVFFNIVWLSLGELAIQIAISDLSQMVKGAMLLQQPYHKKLDALCTLVFWRKLFGKGWWIASPIILLTRLHRFFSEMLACPFCLGFHLAWLTNWLYLDLNITTSIILAPVVLVYVVILDRLHTK